MAKKKVTKKAKPKVKKQTKTKVKEHTKAKKPIKVKKRTVKPAATIDVLEVETEEDESKDTKTDVYEEHACGFMNEAACEEDLDEDGIDVDSAEKSHFGNDSEE